ncbi:DUF2142 domain-containing protein [Agromyces aurantiacus]|uniref:DUF2142 domain-containing protein n=1 Tax=Agromyces aurantiacus TaxID=165814 RepID=A0ABV9R6R1_9MICO|nr:DUF2142 domain-containing protein [Agromyces aurantiacus]MBM7504150.1 hypothetical protein [Agromyces aurantiacus]
MPAPSTGQTSARTLLLLVVTPLLALVALGAWALASPVGASPDDDFHLANIWCSTGEIEGTCETIPDQPTERLVPETLANAAECFKWQGDVSAACSTADSPDRMATTDRINAGGYPPVYYVTMGLIAGDTFDAPSVIGLRMVNAVLFVGMALALYLLLPLRLKSASLWMWLIGLVPLGVFLLASNNPSAWAIISGGTVWLATYGYYVADGWRRWTLLGLALLAMAMGAGARADAAVYAGIGIVVASVLAAERSRRYLFSVLPFAVAGVLAAIAFFAARQSSVLSVGLTGSSHPSELNLPGLIFRNLTEVPSLWAGVFGTWQLGWLDTEMPAIVWASSLGVFAAVCFLGLRSISWRKWTALAILWVALILVPVWVLVQSRVIVGAEVQPRYILPLMVMLGGVALLQLPGRLIDPTRTQLWVVGVALALANAVALHTNIRRYISGDEVADWNLNRHVEWWWDMPITPMVVWAIGTIAFAGCVGLVLWAIARFSGSRRSVAA